MVKRTEVSIIGRAEKFGSVLPFRRTVEPRKLWLCGGLTKLWRITDGAMTFGEWDDIDDARECLALLLKGNPTWTSL